MKKLVIFGSGYLADIVVKAYLQGLLPTYELVGVYSRTAAKAQRLAANVAQSDRPCLPCTSLEALLSLKPDYLVEAASPAAMKQLALPTLANGTSIVTLSIGAFADTPFYEQVKAAATANNARVYIASGATGGFDVLRTATLMGQASATLMGQASPAPVGQASATEASQVSAAFLNVKGVRALRRSSFYDPSMETEDKTIFSGTAREAINTFPTGLNVAVAASLATVGPENLHVTMVSTPEFTGDRQRVEVKNQEVHAVVDVFSATPAIAAWSVVSTLRNIASPIVF